MNTLSISDELTDMLREVTVILGATSSVNDVAEAILRREATRILNLATRRGVTSKNVMHDGHARQQQSQHRSNNELLDMSSDISSELRKQANLQTFENNLGPMNNDVISLQRSPAVPRENRSIVGSNFQYPGSEIPTRKVSF